MSNKFDRENYPSQEPIELVVGDYWVWKKDDLATDYPIDSYSLSYEFHCDSGGGGNHQFTINAVESDNTYYIEVPTTTTDNYNPHDYIWGSYITRTIMYRTTCHLSDPPIFCVSNLHSQPSSDKTRSLVPRAM